MTKRRFPHELVLTTWGTGAGLTFLVGIVLSFFLDVGHNWHYGPSEWVYMPLGWYLLATLLVAVVGLVVYLVRRWITWFRVGADVR